jgi:3-hydroxy acid dehydrogenase/malonic semialdehyde reductase
MEQPRIALITGATAGIGEATAIQLAEAGYRLILTGRRAERLQSLAQRLRSTYGVEVLECCFDIRDRIATQAAVADLPAAWRAIDVLVNNAGLSQGLEPVHTGSEEDWDTMFDTNVKGLLTMSKAVGKIMVERGSGHIINVSSTAAKDVYANGAVYCASKQAVEAITKVLRLELHVYGIKVSSIAPGMADTEFSEVRFKGDRERAAQVYKGFEPLHATDIAAAIWFMINRPAHVNIADLTIMPTAQAASGVVKKQL